jgi:hypothetical protein
MALLNNTVETLISDMTDQYGFIKTMLLEHWSQIWPTNMALLNNTVETLISDMTD